MSHSKMENTQNPEIEIETNTKTSSSSQNNRKTRPVIVFDSNNKLSWADEVIAGEAEENQQQQQQALLSSPHQPKQTNNQPTNQSPGLSSQQQNPSPPTPRSASPSGSTTPNPKKSSHKSRNDANGDLALSTPIPSPLLLSGLAWESLCGWREREMEIEMEIDSPSWGAAWIVYDWI